MKNFKDLREETLVFEYVSIMENHLYTEYTTEQLLDIFFDESFDEHDRLNAAYVLCNYRSDELEEVSLSGLGGMVRNMFSRGAAKGAVKAAKTPAVHPMAAKMAKTTTPAASTAVKAAPKPSTGLWDKVKSGASKLGTALNAAALGGTAYMMSKDKESGAGESETPSTSTSTPSPSKPKSTPSPKPQKSDSTPEEPKKPSVFDDPEFKKDVAKYRSSVPKGTSALEDPAFKKDAASYYSSKNKPEQSAAPKPDIHKDILGLAAQNPETKAATKTLSSIRGR